MARNQIQQRKRRSGPKVKTGCGTCKTRRIKCDEAKPSCQRCSKTGRKCDGYSSDIMISSQKCTPYIDLIQQISVHIPGNAEEKRSFDFFLRNTAAELSGYYDSSFWGNLVLAASTQKPSLRHAVIALGALHEDFSRKRLHSAPSSENQNTQLALNQYSKAIGALRRSLSHGKEEPLTALMSCILFVCFDSLRGHYESAMVHLQSGLGILRDIRKSSTRNQIIEEKIAPLFRRLSLQSIIYVETKSEHEKISFVEKLIDDSGKDIVISGEFKSIEDARNALDQATDSLFRTFYMMERVLPIILQPTETLATFNKSTSQLFLWNLAFEQFMISKSKNFTNREVQGAALLKIHHTTLNIMAGMFPDISDMTVVVEMVDTDGFLKYLDDFQIIIDLSRSLIVAAEQDAMNGRPSLTFSSDFGVVGPLYYVCIHCPTLSIRETAMELMLRCPRREGMWNSAIVAQMIQQFWELGARHRESQEMGFELDEFGMPVPFNDRGIVHSAFFGRPTEVNPTDLSQYTPADFYPSEPNTTRQDTEADALTLPEEVIAQ
ncbi:putative transcription factor cys6 protein [Botrytis fragariae]|uniref:Putative transcription factor cys6 protein n=1 Tax=Botrytis fragariae TaxID=1964551 RepID=A0A8H6AHS6_9HELO|nr:putative transcription factor cys6 protein [Botrytis fragariae]KAF5868013.1 putative transcription factor cys6 protein [Botrytis fragariae]